MPEDGRARKEGNTPPMIAAPTRDQLVYQRQLESDLDVAQAQCQQLETEVAAAQAVWEVEADKTELATGLPITDRLEIHLPLDGQLDHQVGQYPAGSFEAGVPAYGDGPLDKAVELDGQRFVRVGDVGVYERVLNDDEISDLAVHETIAELLALAPNQRDWKQANKLRRFFLRRHAPAPLAAAHMRVVQLTEDFGAQGAMPSHPRLLDWLAVELVESGWDLRGLRRRIVTSAAYRQASFLKPGDMEKDLDNQWLSRGPRFRLPAETIRDQALFVGGLHVEHPEGPSVKPYQPAGLWEEISDEEYERGNGDQLYRRSLYTFWKRTVPHPMMSTFDASSREICSVRKGRTNTPLQALTMLNEDGLVESARGLAGRVMSEARLTPTERLQRDFRLVTSRYPKISELRLLEGSFRHHEAHFSVRPGAAVELLDVGDSAWDGQLNPVELAAYATIANTLLNLDEVVTRH